MKNAMAPTMFGIPKSMAQNIQILIGSNDLVPASLLSSASEIFLWV